MERTTLSLLSILGDQPLLVSLVLTSCLVPFFIGPITSLFKRVFVSRLRLWLSDEPRLELDDLSPGGIRF